MSRRLSTLLSRVYNSEHYQPALPFLSRPGTSQYLCNACNRAADAGFVSQDEAEQVRDAIRERLAGCSTLAAYLNLPMHQQPGTAEYARVAMKYWRAWRAELRAQGK